MARPRTPIGTFGKISHRRLGKGRCEARARYRDWDGVLRAVQCTGPTQAAAELALKRKLSERSLFQPGFIGLSADSRFSALIDYWLEDMEIEDRLSERILGAELLAGDLVTVDFVDGQVTYASDGASKDHSATSASSAAAVASTAPTIE